MKEIGSNVVLMNTSQVEMLVTAIYVVLAILTALLLFTIFKIKLSINAINTKKLILMLERKDSAWKYTNICKRANNTYFAVHKMLLTGNISCISEYITEDFCEVFKEKLLLSSAKRNPSAKIKLKEIKPVVVHDDTDDNLDCVWFYINGNSTNYNIDDMLNELLPQNSKDIVYSGEYWQFVRRAQVWMLNKILSVNEVENLNSLEKL